MLRRIEHTIRERKLIKPGMHVLAAVSGGADSVAMLLALDELRAPLKFKLSVFHLNHGLRGKQSDADAEFVVRLCRKLRLTCEMEKKDAGKLIKPGVSLEMAARATRQDAFLRNLKKRRADVVAVAHHADDQVETMLMRLLAGSGIEGLAGIAYDAQPAPGLRMIRPMLDVSRSEIESFLKQQKVSWREDGSNRDPAILRNAVRMQILPGLKKRFPAAAESLVRLSEMMREEGEWLDRQTRKLLSRVQDKKTGSLRRAVFCRLHVAEQRRVLRTWLSGQNLLRRGVDFLWLEAMRTGAVSKKNGCLQINPHALVKWSDGVIEIVSYEPTRDSAMRRLRLAVPGKTAVERLGCDVTIQASRGFKKAQERIGKFPCTAYIRREGARAPVLYVRCRDAGDRIQPTGMDGSVKLKDIFINAKFPEADRARYPLIATAKDLVWVPGYRVDRRWSVRMPTSPSWRITIKRRAK